jgi:pyruvate formate lyase activating enzyme
MTVANLRPLVVDIKRYSLEDGPGIRSVVFFKGCPLRCCFCDNPEAQDPDVQIVFSRQRCIQAATCPESCPMRTIDLAQPGLITRDQVARCGPYVDPCPTGALRRVGTYYEPEELAEILLRDRPYYERSHGGVTLSGGEPTMFPDYVEKLLRLMKAEDIHVALETGGYFDYEQVRARILPYVDVVYFGLKIADPEAHLRYIGQSNELIIANLRRLMRKPGIELEVWIPLVPGITDGWENLEGLLAILREVGVKSVRLLPYNPLGVYMAESLGRPLPQVPRSFMTRQEVERARNALSELIERIGHDA